METQYAKVLRDVDLEANFVGERLMPRQFGYASDTGALVIRGDNGAYRFVRNYDDAELRNLIAAAGSGGGFVSANGTCGDAANVAAKTSAIAGFVRRTGAIVGISFTYANTASAPTLNVNSTGAASIRYGGSAPTTGMLSAAATHLFQFDGTYWRLLNPAIAGGSSAVSSGSYGSGVSSGYLENDDTFSVPRITVDSAGRITALSSQSMTAVIPPVGRYVGQSNDCDAYKSGGDGNGGTYGGQWRYNTPTGGTLNGSMMVLSRYDNFNNAKTPQIFIEGAGGGRMWYRSEVPGAWTLVAT